MNIIRRLEQTIFYLLIFSLPFQLRVVLQSFGIKTLVEFNSSFLYFTDILVVVLLVLFFVRYLANQSFRDFLKERWRTIHESDPLYIFLIAFFIFTLLASFPPRSLGLSFYQIIKIAEFLLFFVYIVLAFKQYSLTAVLKTFIASGFVQAIIAFLQFTFEKSLSLKLLGEAVLAPDFPEVVKVFVERFFVLRSYGTFPHPNLLAIFLVIVVFFTLYLILKKRFFADYPNPEFLPKEEERNLFKDSFIRVLMIVVVFWLLVGLFLTFSRAVVIIGLITIFLSLLWLYWASWSKFLKRRAFYLGMILVGLLVLNVFMLKTELLARFGSVVSQSFDAVSLDKTAVEFIKEKPLFGVGAGYYTFKLNEVNPDLPPLLLQPVNNVYLLIAAETLSYLFYGLIKAFRKEQDLTAKLWKSQLIIIFIFMLAVSFFHHGFWTLQQGQLLFWFLLGILVATATETKKSLTTQGKVT